MTLETAREILASHGVSSADLAEISDSAARQLASIFEDSTNCNFPPMSEFQKSWSDRVAGATLSEKTRVSAWRVRVSPCLTRVFEFEETAIEFAKSSGGAMRRVRVSAGALCDALETERKLAARGVRGYASATHFASETDIDSAPWRAEDI